MVTALHQGLPERVLEAKSSDTSLRQYLQEVEMLAGFIRRHFPTDTTGDSWMPGPFFDLGEEPVETRNERIDRLAADLGLTTSEVKNLEKHTEDEVERTLHRLSLLTGLPLRVLRKVIEALKLMSTGQA